MLIFISMATTYTRLQLRDFQTSSVDLTAKSHTFTLVNNNNSTAYFAMEGVRYWDGVGFVYKTLFPSASLSALTNCTVARAAVLSEIHRLTPVCNSVLLANT